MEKFKVSTMILAGMAVIAVLALIVLPIFNLTVSNSRRGTESKLGEITFLGDYDNNYDTRKSEVASITKTFLIFIIVMFIALVIFNLKKSMLPVILIAIATFLILMVMWASADITWNESGNGYHVALNTGFTIPLLMSLATAGYGLVKIVVDSFRKEKK